MGAVELVRLNLLCVKARHKHWGIWELTTLLPHGCLVTCRLPVATVITTSCRYLLWEWKYIHKSCSWCCESGCIFVLSVWSCAEECLHHYSVWVCADWLTLTRLDRSLDVLSAQHPCKCHGGRLRDTHTCMGLTVNETGAGVLGFQITASVR